MPHPLDKFKYCPVCGSSRFRENDVKSKRCADCGFTYYINPSSATVAFIVNSRNELLVAVRDREPARGTLDLPGGFADMGETIEEGVAREVMEETGLVVCRATYLFSLPNTYLFSGFPVPTLDSFFRCEVDDTSLAQAHDDAASLLWIPLAQVDPTLFGLKSVSEGVRKFVREYVNVSLASL